MEHNSTNTALLVMDMQQGIIGRYPGAVSLLAKVAAAIDFAHAQHIQVIYAVIGFRKGAPDVSPNNKSLNALKRGFDAIDMADYMKVHPEIAPKEGDITVIKRRISAFTGSDLEVILRSLNIQHLVLTGISTSGVVLATLMEAADKDFCLTVLSDCCADPDEEVHQLLINKILCKRASILTLKEWSAASITDSM
jgi:nicotinamidase-related amidase